MRSALPVAGLLGLLTSYVSATALTYKLAPNERECFYTSVDTKDAKIAFYFAVQSGGSFDSALTHMVFSYGRVVRDTDRISQSTTKSLAPEMNQAKSA
jgi:hypothetical protein